MSAALGRWLYRGVSCAGRLRPVVSTGTSVSQTWRGYCEKLEFKEPKEGHRFNKSHEWASLDGSTATIGVTNYAQEKLGDVVFVELPTDESTQFTKGDQLGVLESVKAAADVNVPLSGTLKEVNSALEDSPELINEDPYTKGWLIKLKDVDTAEYEELMSAEQYRQFLEESI